MKLERKKKKKIKPFNNRNRDEIKIQELKNTIILNGPRINFRKIDRAQKIK